ncbi:hypothetical protein CW304_27030 [Bacillus sp. UFRGS-B20]|nr:hypothetical protein CW304_27030 [Bacillus sp. UFRGS-B20]
MTLNSSPVTFPPIRTFPANFQTGLLLLLRNCAFPSIRIVSAELCHQLYQIPLIRACYFSNSQNCTVTVH